MANTEFVTVGLAAVASHLGELEKTFLKKLGAAMFTEAILIEQESRIRTPVMTGALRGSHETLLPEYTRDGIEVKIVVGGPAAPYAVEVHEKVEIPHRTGRSKFLQSAIEEAAEDFFPRVITRANIQGSE